MMLKRLDGSQFLIDLLANVSSWLARQRGLPIVVGLVLFIAGGVLQFVNMALDSTLVEFFQVLFHNLGVIVALIGILLAEPLGE